MEFYKLVTIIYNINYSSPAQSYPIYQYPNTKVVATPTYKPIIKYLRNIFLVIIGSFGYLGGFLITSGSGGLKDNAVAGGPSVTKFSHNN